MFRSSRRDEIAVEALLPSFAREITADLERHNPARREARIKEIKGYQRDFRALGQRQRAVADKKQDDELRTRLNGKRGHSRESSCTLLMPSGLCFDQPPRLPDYRVVKPSARTQQLPIRSKFTSRRPRSAALTRSHRASTPKKRPVLNPSKFPFCRHRGFQDIASSGRKDFEVKRVCKKQVVLGSVVYTVHWKASWVPEELIVLDTSDQRHYVEAERGRWYIRKRAWIEGQRWCQAMQGSLGQHKRACRMSCQRQGGYIGI